MATRFQPPPVDTRLPAYLQVRDQLATRIASGEWRVDEALPSENKLAAETGLSVGTIRKAIEQLVAEGLLERRRGSGTYLRKRAFNASLFRFFSLRDADGATTIPSSRLLSRQRLTAPAHVARALGVDDCLCITRLRSQGDEVLLCEEIWIPAALFPGLEALAEEEIGALLYPFYLERFGVFIASAVDDVSFGAASPAIARSLRLPAGTAVAIIERTAHAADGAPVEWRIAHGPAERFRYRSRIG